MTSPFPGMDPYLEDPAFWADFHVTFINCLREEIAAQLPDAYEARLDESVNLIKMSPELIKLICHEGRGARDERRVRIANAIVSPLASRASPLMFEEIRQAHIEVLHRPDRSLVAVLEVLSPFNKTGEGYKQYRVKRAAVLGQFVHLVELDLLVGGTRPKLRYPLPPGDYYAYLSRADRRFDGDVYPWTVRDPLPTIPIPLKAPDADIPIDLAKPFRTTYERGRYAPSLAYGKPPVAPLKRADAQWARTLTERKKSRRTG